jgi:dTDP-4-dehydrorhamnose 3,5-epimerase-like enzyme
MTDILKKDSGESAVRVIELPRIFDERGNLTFIEEMEQVPFRIERVYWIYDVPGGQIRGGHAFLKQQELIIALSGSFDVIVDNGTERQIIRLNRSYNALYISSGIWRQMQNFSTNALALVLSSTHYDPVDYIHDYNRFLTLMGNDKQ